MKLTHKNLVRWNEENPNEQLVYQVHGSLIKTFSRWNDERFAEFAIVQLQEVSRKDRTITIVEQMEKVSEKYEIFRIVKKFQSAAEPVANPLRTDLIKLVQSAKSSSMGATFDVTTNTATFSSDLGTDLSVRLRNDGRIDVTEVSEYGPQTTFISTNLKGVRNWIKTVEADYKACRS